MKLEDKQEKFEYRSPADLYVHEEPFSPREWNSILRKIGGNCPLGDPRLRIVWGGTAKKRGYIQKPEGSVPAMLIKYPAAIPRIRTLTGYRFFNEKNEPVFVVRPDQIPKGALSIPIFDYIQLGALRWMFERKCTPAELIAIGQYPDPLSPEAKTFGVRDGRSFIAPMDPRGEYVGLYPLQTPEGRYFEPDAAWFDLLRRTEKETKEATEGDKLVMLNKALEAIERNERKDAEYKEEQKDIIFEEAVIEVEKAPRSRVIFH